METIEGNKLIAEFMGWESGRYSHLPNRLHRTDEKNVEWATDISNLMYHSSWDWVMPALKKYGDLPVNDVSRKDWDLIVIGLGAIDIDMTWNFFVSALKKLITTKPQPNAK